MFAWLINQIKAAHPDHVEALRSARAPAKRNLAILKGALNCGMENRLMVRSSGCKTVAPSSDVGTRREISGNSHVHFSNEQRTVLFSKTLAGITGAATRAVANGDTAGRNRSLRCG